MGDLTVKNGLIGTKLYQGKEAYGGFDGNLKHTFPAKQRFFCQLIFQFREKFQSSNSFPVRVLL